MSTINQTSSEVITYIVINHATKPKVLMLCGENGWSLPTVVPKPHAYKSTIGLNQSIYDTYGIVVTLLQILSHKRAPDTGEESVMYAMNNHSPGWQSPPAGRWINSADLTNLKLATPSHRPLITAWLKELESQSSALPYALWQMPGWFDETMAWMKTQLASRGICLTGTFRQFGVTPVHCLFEISTTSGNLYFKAVRGTLVHEQPLTCALAQLCPQYLPEVVLADDERHYWLTRDIGGERLWDVMDLKRWDEALQTFARLQIDCIAHLDRLYATGCPDWSLTNLAMSIDEFFNATLPELLSGKAIRQNNERRAGQLALAGRLKELCSRLADYNFPNTIGHGDLNFGNIQVTDNSISFLDWAEGYIGHPLFTAFDVINYFGFRRADLKNRRAQWRMSYFEPWEGHFSADHLMRAYCLARPLALLRGVMRGSQYTLSPERTPEQKAKGIDELLPQVGLIREAAYSSRIDG